MPTRTIRILGTRGIPASHGGFETFAEYLSLYLVKKGWRVVVYCQEDGKGPIFSDNWNGVERIRIPISYEGARGTIIFDLKSTVDASRYSDLCLTLGYNTAIFCLIFRFKKIFNVINMDGLEWKRDKWRFHERVWLWLNERLGCWFGNHLIADHPEIKNHLETRVNSEKITMIPYGSEEILQAKVDSVISLGLTPGNYLTVIARPEPENSIIEIVRGFSKKNRGCKLVVLGNYNESNLYHRSVKAAASAEVIFTGAIYDKEVVQALRFHSLAYIHGHQVGGTNPSLVEALGARNAVIAHDNKFNRWVAGTSALYFSDELDFDRCISILINDKNLVEKMRNESKSRFVEDFTWLDVLQQYETLLAANCR